MAILKLSRNLAHACKFGYNKVFVCWFCSGFYFVLFFLFKRVELGIVYFVNIDTKVRDVRVLKQYLLQNKIPAKLQGLM